MTAILRVDQTNLQLINVIFCQSIDLNFSVCGSFNPSAFSAVPFSLKCFCLSLIFLFRSVSLCMAFIARFHFYSGFSVFFFKSNSNGNPSPFKVADLFFSSPNERKNALETLKFIFFCSFLSIFFTRFFFLFNYFETFSIIRTTKVNKTVQNKQKHRM